MRSCSSGVSVTVDNHKLIPRLRPRDEKLIRVVAGVLRPSGLESREIARESFITVRCGVERLELINCAKLGHASCFVRKLPATRAVERRQGYPCNRDNDT